MYQLLLGILALIALVLAISSVYYFSYRELVTKGSVVVILSAGRISKRVYSGFFFLDPLTETIKTIQWTRSVADPQTHVINKQTITTHHIPLNHIVHDVPEWKCTTRDGSIVYVDCRLMSQIVHEDKAVGEQAPDDLWKYTEDIFMIHLGTYVRSIDILELHDRLSSTINSTLKTSVNDTLQPYGITLVSIDLQQVRYPKNVADQMERLLLAENDRKFDLFATKTRLEIAFNESEHSAKIEHAKREARLEAMKRKAKVMAEVFEIYRTDGKLTNSEALRLMAIDNKLPMVMATIQPPISE